MNTGRLASQTAQDGIDVLVASTPDNIGYLTNYWNVIQEAVREIEIYALFSSGWEKPVLIASIGALVSSADLVKSEDVTVMPYGSFHISEGTDLSTRDQEIWELLQMERSPSAVETLVKVIRERGVDRAVLGIQNEMSYRTVDRLRKEFPKLRMREATHSFHMARMVKTGAEIENLRNAATIIERAVASTLECLAEGISEVETAAELNRQIISQGAAPAFAVVGFGANAAHVDAQPSDRRLKKGDIVRFDVGCAWRQYYSDTAKTVVFGGEPTERQERYYDALVAGHKNGIAMANPGTRVSDIFSAIMEAIRRDIPHYMRHHCGHGIGREVHQPPIIAPHDHTVLEKDMVINLEAPYYELGFGGLQVEDTLLIGETGNEVMTTIDETLRF